MRTGRLGVVLVALACGSCSGGLAGNDNLIEQHGTLQATYGAYGQPAGYYPGRAEPFGGDPAAYKAWLAKNETGVDEIQRRIVEIREKTRAPGCIGEDKSTCIATLAQRLTVADAFFLKGSNIFADTTYDVNGRPVTGSKIMFDAYPPDAKSTILNEDIYRHTTFDLSLGRDGKVATVIASLPRDPTYARTQAQYDATGVYEVVAAVTAKTCPTLGRAEVARWVENTIKPRSRLGPKTHGEGLQGRYTATDFFSPKTALCGRIFQFHSVQGKEQVGFQHQRFGGMTIQIQ